MVSHNLPDMLRSLGTLNVAGSSDATLTLAYQDLVDDIMVFSNFGNSVKKYFFNNLSADWFHQQPRSGNWP